jgi:hypothetical protein
MAPAPHRGLELFEEFACRAGNKNSALHTTLTVFYPLYNACTFAAFGAVGALGRIHNFLAVRSLSDLGLHVFSLSPRGAGRGGSLKYFLGVTREVRGNYIHDAKFKVQLAIDSLHDAPKTMKFCRLRDDY